VSEQGEPHRPFDRLDGPLGDGLTADGFGEATPLELDPGAHEALERLRSFCAMLPETAEIDALGQPTFRVATRAFAVFEVVDGRPTVCVKLHPDTQAAVVARDGFRAEPDTGHHRWTVVDTVRVPWPEVDELVVASYRLVAPLEFVAQLDALLGRE
jgi:predicted DNA-binding protein (MmcQ/YjbR family)